ncbi:MAG: Coenzyme F420 hydrogenase/dehydrogenase, beta subunit C-terminal domain [Ruminococcus sp.]|nr:Coenzyme F420 hydrogenase/dehydrogenase, beta subunit C-terminal domain [Ruminococcus sp.]
MSSNRPADTDFDFTSIQAYAGYFKKSYKLFSCASGGAATAISECFIKNGGIVFGACYTDDFKGACFGCARTIEELEKFRSSKYINTEKKIYDDGKWVSVFSAIENALNNGQKVLFIGLGCDVGALLKTLDSHNVNHDALFTIDLICHGPTYAEVQKQYIEQLESKFNSKVTSFSVRYKKKGWEPPYVHAEFSNGQVFEELFYESDFGFAFKKYSRIACQNCQFKGENHVADMTVGDYWGCTKGMECYNPNGVSVLLVKTDKGKNMVEELKTSTEFQLYQADTEYAVRNNSNYYLRREFDMKTHRQFDEDFKKNGLHHAVVNSECYGRYKKLMRKERIKRFIPAKAVRFMKRIKSKLKHS